MHFLLIHLLRRSTRDEYAAHDWLAVHGFEAREVSMINVCALTIKMKLYKITRRFKIIDMPFSSLYTRNASGGAALLSNTQRIETDGVESGEEKGAYEKKRERERKGKASSSSQNAVYRTVCR